MYELSRELFRQLRPGLRPNPSSPAQPARTLLALCEATVDAVARTPNARRHHAARLFTQARRLYPPGTHRALIERIEAGIDAAHRGLLQQVGDRSGGLLRCAAVNRRSQPCMREPIPGLRYCPSHRHMDHAASAA